MWQPEPDWQRLPGGIGPSAGGLWLARDAGREFVVSRLLAPAHDDPAWLARPTHYAWWRRPAEVAASGIVTGTPGLRSPAAHRVEEDEEGITVWLPLVVPEPAPGLFVATCLARFAAAELETQPWLARNQLADRMLLVEHNGGWPTLARTTLADVADRLWSRRAHHLELLAGLPLVPQHGDPVPANLVGRDGDDVVAVDWATLGLGPVGADLGYFALSAREEFEPLLDAYVAGLTGPADRREAQLGALVTLVYTLLSRVEAVLARAARGEGALAGKYHHPSVAPHLRALQRQFPQLEALL